MNFIAAFQGQGLIAHQYLPNVKTITNIHYLDFLASVLHPEVVKRRIRSPLILQDNAGPHRHHDVKAFFTRHRWTVLKHPPYSPLLSPPDFDGFSKIKRPNKGIRFIDVTHLKSTYEMTINELNNQKSFTGIQKLPERWEKVIQVMGHYFE